MLFNSYTFIFLFLPFVLFGYYALGKIKRDFALAFLLFAGFFFYGYFEINFLPLLISSILINFSFSRIIVSISQKSLKKFVFILSILFNIGLLSYYKYADFLISIFNDLGANFNFLHLVLPLGISFFTITQLLYLWDLYLGIAKEENLLNYSIFVSFFPHLLSGPILFPREMFEQIRNIKIEPIAENFAKGFAFFSIGLFKKVIIADSLVPYVNFGFSSPSDTSFIMAWLVAVSYFLELFFDFSGYTDMALGVSKMLNFNIPINFNSPLRSTSIAQFWQRWHISLTQSLTSAIYMPLVKFFGKPSFLKSALASSVTLFIVGIWHGAGYGFVIFALLHSVALFVFQLWKKYRPFNLYKPIAHFLTLFFITISLVFFRAETVDAALILLNNMFFGDIMLPARLSNILSDFNLHFASGNVAGLLSWPAFLTAVFIVAFSPPSQKIVKNMTPKSYALAALFSAMFIASVLKLNSFSVFLYFQF